MKMIPNVDIFTPAPRLRAMRKIYEYEIPQEMKDEILALLQVEPDAEVTFEKLLIKVTKNDTKDIGI